MIEMVGRAVGSQTGTIMNLDHKLDQEVAAINEKLDWELGTIKEMLKARQGAGHNSRVAICGNCGHLDCRAEGRNHHPSAV